MGTSKINKKPRLVEAAKLLTHQKSFRQTTLADIAENAGVPLGNMYYYFKTKESVGLAVIKELTEEYKVILQDLNKHSDPWKRLVAVIAMWEPPSKALENIASHGCPVGTLCQELAKEGGFLADQAAKILYNFLQWCETQFESLGFGNQSSVLAVHFISNLQGIYLLMNTFNDVKLFEKQAELMVKWLQSLKTEVDQKSKKIAEAA